MQPIACIFEPDATLTNTTLPASLSSLMIPRTSRIMSNRSVLSTDLSRDSIFALPRPFLISAMNWSALSADALLCTSSHTLSALRILAGSTILSTSNPTGAMWTLIPSSIFIDIYIMDSIPMLYNTFGPARRPVSMHSGGMQGAGGRMARPAAFYPRIIREFDDGPDEEPMLYTRR